MKRKTISPELWKKIREVGRKLDDAHVALDGLFAEMEKEYGTVIWTYLDEPLFHARAAACDFDSVRMQFEADNGVEYPDED